MLRRQVMKKCCLFSLVILTFCFAPTWISSQTNPPTDDARVKRNVELLGQGAKVVVTTKNGLKVEGRIGRLLDHSFDITGSKSGGVTTIAYDQVDEIKKAGWSKGAKIALGVGIGAAIVTSIVVGVSAKRGLGGFCPLGCGPF
jgi:hypothetical protein